MSEDDFQINHYELFENHEIVVTEKLDGENTSLYPDGYIHARSINGNSHPSQDWVKKFWAERAYLLPETYRICGENVYARHSIPYNNLTTFFYGFSVWEADECLDWDTSLMVIEELGIQPVRTFYRGQFQDETILDLIAMARRNRETIEGFVIRKTGNFRIKDFQKSVAKYVRKDHVQTDKHWKENWEKNSLTS